MRLMRSLTVGFFAALLVAPHALAQTIEPSVSFFSAQPVQDPWPVSVPSFSDDAAPAVPAMPLSLPSMSLSLPSMSLAHPSMLLQQDNTQPLHAAAVEHSDAYETRKKIHKYASFATLPLFAAEVALGQSLYNTPANLGSKRTLHGIVGAGIVGLSGVNTVTGAWNMFGEDRKDPEGRTLRLVHGLLMMAADVGFVVTERLGPNSRSSRQSLTYESRKATHRNVAIASISVATTGYLVMLFGNH
jgi:hypothetical protein